MKKLTVVPHTFNTQEDLMNSYRHLEPISSLQVVGIWQKCPVCNGTGRVWSEYAGGTNRYQDTCRVCEGRLIISTVTGLPPAKPEEPVG